MGGKKEEELPVSEPIEIRKTYTPKDTLVVLIARPLPRARNVRHNSALAFGARYDGEDSGVVLQLWRRSGVFHGGEVMVF